LQFGLGETKAIERVIVRWPNGEEEPWNGLAVDQIHKLTEGSAGR